MPDMDLLTTLKSKLAGAQRIGILGIGSELRGDDWAGMRIAQILEERCARKAEERLAVFYGSSAPENLTGEIKKYQPTHLIIIDAADTSAEPGTITFITPEQLIGISFSTHMMPINIMVDYMLQSFTAEVIIIGIQPKLLTFGKPLSPQMQESIDQLAAALEQIILP